jgi:hypothetical protein
MCSGCAPPPPISHNTPWVLPNVHCACRPGNVFLYGPEGGQIAGFRTSASSGFSEGNVTISAGLLVDDLKGNEPLNIMNGRVAN